MTNDELNQLRDDSATFATAPFRKVILNWANEAACPWLEFREYGEAGSRAYAERVSVWLSLEFAPEVYAAKEDHGWWYSEKRNW